MPLQMTRGAIERLEFDWAGEPPGPYLQPGESIGAYTVAMRGGLAKLSDERVGSKVYAMVQAPAVLPIGTVCEADCTADIVPTDRRWTATLQVLIV